MADWNTPTLSSLYTDFLSYMKDRDVDIAKQFDGTTSTNLPTGAIKWNSTSNRWNKWDGSAWQELATSYGFNSITLPNGTANGVAYLNGSKVLTTGSALTFDGTNIRLGIGTNSPQRALALYGVTESSLTIQNYTTGSAASDGLLLQQYGLDSYIWNLENSFMSFGVNNSEQMRLTSTGLGIGTSSPAVKLHVYTSGDTPIKSQSTGAASYFQLSNSTDANGYLGYEGTSLTLYTSGSKKATLDSSGNLGLGVTPSAWGTANYRKAFDVSYFGGIAATNFDVNLVANAYYNGTNWIYKGSSSASYYSQIYGQHQWHIAPSGTAGNAISFTQAMTLDASGLLGVGTTTPSSYNQYGTGLVVGTSSVAGSAGVSIVGNAAGYSSVYFSKTTGNVTAGLIEYGHASNYMSFMTNGSERMRIDSSGNVGIGTSSPARDFVLSRSIDANLSIVAGSSGQAQLLLGQSGQDAYGRVQYTNSTNALAFYSNNAERMRIDSSGNLLVGTTGGNGAKAQVNFAGNAVDGLCLIDTTNTNGALFAVFRNNAGTGIGSISRNGTSNIAYNTSSDYRLKENIQPMQGALTVVQQLNPVTYTWKADGSDGQGFIAHELQAVVPDCVTGEKDAVRIVDVLDDEGRKIGTKEEPVYQGIDTSFLVATLTKAIQEQQEQINQLKAEVAALKQGA